MLLSAKVRHLGVKVQDGESGKAVSQAVAGQQALVWCTTTMVAIPSFG